MDAVNILIVDDEPSGLNEFILALQNAGNHCVVVTSLNAALDHLSAGTISLIFIGLTPLNAHGLKMARGIRLSAASPLPPLIFVTCGDVEQALLEQALLFGCSDLLHWPLPVPLLCAKVNYFVKRGSTADASLAPGQYGEATASQFASAKTAAEYQHSQAQLQKRLDRTEALYRVTRSLVGHASIHELLHALAESVANTLLVDLAAIIVVNFDSESISDVVLGGCQQHRWHPLTYQQVVDGLPGQALRTMKPILSLDGVNRPYADANGSFERDPGSVMVAPLHIQNKLYGVMMAINWGGDAYLDSQDLELLAAMATQAAIAISQAGTFDDTLRSLAQVRSVIENVPSGVVLLDAQHRILLKNPVATVYIDAIAEVDDSGHLLKIGETPLTDFGASLFKGPNDQQGDNGTRILPVSSKMFEVLVRPLSDSHGKEQWILLLRDITSEMTALDHQLTQQRQAVVGQLAAGVAHDFNNILAVIILYCQLLQKNADQQKREQYLNTIHQQANRGAGLISQLLDFGRQSLMKPRSIDLVPFFRDFLDLLSRTFPENISLNFTTNIDALYLHVDPTHLQQVFMNLAINARDAMASSGYFQVELDSIDLGLHDTAPIPRMAPGIWAKIIVRDSGCGMSDEVRDKIFEPFFTTKAPDEGTGLGLAQVYGIVQQLGGEISVTSILDVGSTFVIYLPLKGLVSVPLMEETSLTEVHMQSEGHTILLVEDEPTVRNALEEMLTNLGFQELFVAENGRDALECFRAVGGKIDLVFSDMVMPQMGGLELYEALRNEKPGIKMIISTGYPLEQGGEVLLERGIVDWVLKPFSIEEVSAKIYKALLT